MIIIGNGRVLTRDKDNPYIEDGAVAVDNEIIVTVGERQSILHEYPQHIFIDAHGGLIMPALINAHSHIYSTMARGLSIKGYAPHGFLDILDGLWWTIDRHLNNQDIRYSAALTALDCIRNGVTTIFDHHAGYGDIEGSLFTIEEQIRAAGLRCSLCYEVSDRDGMAKAQAAIRENAEYIRYARMDKSGMTSGMMGMHASFTLSDATLDKAVAEADGAGCHIHVAEGIEDELHCLEHYGKRVVERLWKHGVLGSHSIAGHGIHINQTEMDILKHTDTPVIHNPESNMGNAVGCPPTMEMIRRGLLCGLGTDGYTNDMLESYKVANVLHKHALADCNAAWAEVPAMLFDNNPRLAARFFPARLGILAAGASADIIISDYQPITPFDGDNANGHILFGVNGRSVITTIAAGQVLMRDREILVMDEAKVISEAKVQAASLWQRING